MLDFEITIYIITQQERWHFIGLWLGIALYFAIMQILFDIFFQKRPFSSINCLSQQSHQLKTCEVSNTQKPWASELCSEWSRGALMPKLASLCLTPPWCHFSKNYQTIFYPPWSILSFSVNVLVSSLMKSVDKVFSHK